MMHLFFTAIFLFLLVLPMNSFSGEQLDMWDSRIVYVNDIQMTYFYPKKPHLYNEPKGNVTLNGEMYVDIANFIYEKPVFYRWKPAEVNFQYFFWNVAREGITIEKTEDLYLGMNKLKEQGRFLGKPEIVNLNKESWVYYSKGSRETFYKYFKDGYVLCVKVSYSDGASKKVKKKYSDYLEAAVKKLEIEEIL